MEIKLSTNEAAAQDSGIDNVISTPLILCGKSIGHSDAADISCLVLIKELNFRNLCASSVSLRDSHSLASNRFWNLMLIRLIGQACISNMYLVYLYWFM